MSTFLYKACVNKSTMTYYRHNSAIKTKVPRFSNPRFSRQQYMIVSSTQLNSQNLFILSKLAYTMRFRYLSQPNSCINVTIIEPRHGISHNLVCATSKASDQPAHMRSLIRAFASRLNILWLLIYWSKKHLEFRTLKGGCTGSSKSTIVFFICHVGNHMSRVKCHYIHVFRPMHEILVWFCLIWFFTSHQQSFS